MKNEISQFANTIDTVAIISIAVNEVPHTYQGSSIYWDNVCYHSDIGLIEVSSDALSTVSYYSLRGLESRGIEIEDHSEFTPAEDEDNKKRRVQSFNYRTCGELSVAIKAANKINIEDIDISTISKIQFWGENDSILLQINDSIVAIENNFASYMKLIEEIEEIEEI